MRAGVVPQCPGPERPLLKSSSACVSADVLDGVREPEPFGGTMRPAMRPSAIAITLAIAVGDAPAARLSFAAISWRASDTRPEAGASITLTATCSEAPTRYLWVGCEAFNDTCVATSTTVGTQTYSVIASNDIGTGLPASISVAWQAAAGTPLGCDTVRRMPRLSIE